MLSLSLGIGANAAIYSLFDQMVLRRVPVASPDELVNLGAPGPKPGSTSCNNAGGCDEVFSYPMFRDLEQESDVFGGVAAHRSFGANLAFRGQTASASGMQVSGGYFGVLGLTPAIGRLLGSEDDRTEGAHFVAVLSHAYWQDRFGGSPDVLNETLIVNGQSMTIVGVAPRGFHGTTLGQRPSVFVPISMRGLLNPGWEGFENRRSYWVYVFARRKPGVSLEKARVGINVPYRAIVNDVEAPLQEGMSDATLARFRAKQITVEPGERGQSDMHQEAFAPLVLMLVVTGVVLLIACANIANLLLARAASRGTELAVRLSIGASPRPGDRPALDGVRPPWGHGRNRRARRGTMDPEPRGRNAPRRCHGCRLGRAGRWDRRVRGARFRSAPACSSVSSRHSTAHGLTSSPALRAQSGLASGARSAGRFRTALATGQIALSMALLISAGLFVKSLMQVSRIELGVRTDDMITFGISPELNGYTPEQSLALFDRVEEELRAQPGVTSVTSSMVGLLAGNSWGNNVTVEGFEAGPDTDTNSRFNQVGSGYFRTFGVPLLAGREFAATDGMGRSDGRHRQRSLRREVRTRTRRGRKMDAHGRRRRARHADRRPRSKREVLRRERHHPTAVLSAVSTGRRHRIHELLRSNRPSGPRRPPHSCEKRSRSSMRTFRSRT